MFAYETESFKWIKSYNNNNKKAHSSHGGKDSSQWYVQGEIYLETQNPETDILLKKYSHWIFPSFSHATLSLLSLVLRSPFQVCVKGTSA